MLHVVCLCVVCLVLCFDFLVLFAPLQCSPLCSFHYVLCIFPFPLSCLSPPVCQYYSFMLSPLCLPLIISPVLLSPLLTPAPHSLISVSVLKSWFPMLLCRFFVSVRFCPVLLCVLSPLSSFLQVPCVSSPVPSFLVCFAF